MRTPTLLLAVGFTATCAAQYPGALDTTYRHDDLGFGRGDGTDRQVLCAAMRPDGRVLLGGQFERLNGSYQRIQGAINADGTLDTTFMAQQLPGNVQPWRATCMALQPNGMLLVGGNFSRGIHRMQMSGDVDSTFITGVGFEAVPYAEVTALALQPDGRVIVGGRFTSFNGSPVTNLARLNANGTLDATFQTANGLNGQVMDIALQPDGRIVVVGRFSYCWGSCGHMVRLNSNGSLDATFQALPGTDQDIEDVLLRSDGTLVMAGLFYNMHGGGQPYLCRLTSGGALDPGFSTPPGVITQAVTHIAEQADQRLLLAVNYSMLRLMPDGTADNTFAAPVLTYQPSYSRSVHVMIQWPDGRIFMAGEFVSVNGKESNHLALLNADGTLDDSFNKPYGFNSSVLGMSVLPDGSVIANGVFNGFDGTPTNTWNQSYSGNVVRLTPAGELDTAFAPYGDFGLHPVQAVQPDGKVVVGAFKIFRLNTDGTLDSGFPNQQLPNNNLINDMAVQPDGKILLSGNLQGFAGIPSPGIVRLNNDGTVDGSFNVGSGFAYPTGAKAIVLQPDGRIVVSGAFTSYNGTPANYLCRLMPDGAIDTSFHIGTGPSSSTRALLLLPDGRILVGGSFTSFNGIQARTLVLLHPDGTVDGSFVNETTVSLPDGYPVLEYDPIGKLLYGSYTIPGYVTRLNLDGSVDPTFDVGSGAGQAICALSVQPDTTYLIAGNFTSYNGVGRNRIARIQGGHSHKTTVQVKVWLGGPFLGYGMSFTLWNQNLLPMTEPYTALGYPHIGGGGESVDAWAAYPNYITDWVVVELRDPLNPSNIIATQSALLRRDGQVLSTRFLKNLVFDVPNGNYFVAVHHRNHLGVMTATAIALDDMPTHMDFTLPSTPTYGTAAQKLVGPSTVLWEGDVNTNGTLKYVGAANDRDAILIAIGGVDPLNTVTGYLREDVNLDGIVKYAGATNDRDAILVNLPGAIPTATRIEQAP